MAKTLSPMSRLLIFGILACAASAGVAAISANDPDGMALRIGMIMMTVGAATLLPWQVLPLVVLTVWLGPNYARSEINEYKLFSTEMLLELPGLIALAVFAAFTRRALFRLEEDSIYAAAIGLGDETVGLDPDTGVYEERLLKPAIEAELVRARRFKREFALVLVGIESKRQRFDYRDEESWNASFTATARLMRSTRTHIDRSYRHGASSFAMILPESGNKEVMGLIHRLRRVARNAVPAEGEVGGPLPTHFGVTFFPQSATTSEDLLRRAEVALRIAEKKSDRIQIDGAAAPTMEPPETLRDAEVEAEAPEIAMVASNGSAAPVLAEHAVSVAPRLTVVTDVEAETDAAVEETVAIQPPKPEPTRLMPHQVTREGIIEPSGEELAKIEALAEAEREVPGEANEPPILHLVPTEDKLEEAAVVAEAEPVQFVAAQELETPAAEASFNTTVEPEMPLVAEQEMRTTGAAVSPQVAQGPESVGVIASQERETPAAAASSESIEQPEPLQLTASQELVAATSIDMVEEPQPMVATQQAPTGDTGSLDDSVAELLKHLDGTLDMIRSLKTPANPS